MKRSWKNFKWPAVLAALLILSAWAVYVPKSARAQAPAGSRVFRAGPLTVKSDQSLTLSYSNIFSSRATSVKMFLLNANNGALVGGSKVEILVPAGGGTSQSFTGSGTPVVAIVLLAEPRPDPLLSLQVTGAGGLELLGELRSDPTLVTETTIP